MVQFSVRVEDDKAQEIRDRYEEMARERLPAKLSLNDFLAFLVESGLDTLPEPAGLRFQKEWEAKEEAEADAD